MGQWAKDGKAVCNEHFRLTAKCADCGPNWGNLNKCMALCDAEPACKFLTFFSDNGCRMYTGCAPTWQQVYGVITSIYEKGVAMGTPGGKTTGQFTPVVATPAGPVPVMSSTGVAKLPSAYQQVIAPTNTVCDEVARLPAPCGVCGPNWGNLGQCKTMCDKEPLCKFITYFSDGGCRMYSKCDSKWHQHYGSGLTKSKIYQKGI